MKPLTRKTFSIYWQHSKRYKLGLFFVALGMLGITAGEVYLPFWYKAVFDTLAEGGAGAELIRIVWIIALVNLITLVFRRMLDFANTYFQSRVISDLMNTCASYMHGHSYSFFTNNFTGSLVRRVNRFARAFEDIADEITYHIGQTALRVVVILGVLFVWRWQLAVVLLIWTVLFAIFNYWFARFKLRYDLQRASTDSEATAHLADTVTNSINIKMFATRAQEQTAYEKITERLARISRFSWNLGNIMHSFQSLLLVVLEFGVLYVAVQLWQEGRLTIGDFALIQVYLIQIFYRIWDIGNFIRKLFERLADANEMTEILVAPHEIVDAPNASIFKPGEGRIVFGKANFGYHDELSVLRDFDFVINPGERVALVGPSGGGKSTIVKLLLRFYDLDGGQILIDNQDIAKVTQDSLRANIAMVPQDPILFHRTLEENIRYAKPEAGKEEVVRAAKQAHAHEFISQLPEGYDTFVGERGIKLSGGERQRIAIARAILKNAPILVLDEATSSLDSESEYYIQDALKGLMKGHTTIVIAHRLSTIMQMDRIVVLEDGKIVEEGKHGELLKIKQGLYQRLWDIQAGGFAPVSN